MQKFHKYQSSFFNFFLKSLHFRSILVVLVFSVLPFWSNAQLQLPTANNMRWIPENVPTRMLLSSSLQPSFSHTKLLSDFLKPNPSFYHKPQVPRAYCFEDLALFCKIEVQLEKRSKVPIKFRLGSVDYVDQLESKR